MLYLILQVALPSFLAMHALNPEMKFSSLKRTTTARVNSRRNHSRLLGGGPCIVGRLGRLRDCRRFLGLRSLIIESLAFQIWVSEGSWVGIVFDLPSPPTKLNATGKKTNACNAASITNANQILK